MGAELTPEMKEFHRYIRRWISQQPECKEDGLFQERLLKSVNYIREDMSDPGTRRIGSLGAVSTLYAARAFLKVSDLPNLSAVSRPDVWVAAEFGYLGLKQAVKLNARDLYKSRIYTFLACQVLFYGCLARREDMVRLASAVILDPAFAQLFAADISPDRRKVTGFAVLLAQSGGEATCVPGLETVDEVLRVHLSVAKSYKDDVYFLPIFGMLPVFAAVALPRGSHALLDQTRDLIAELTPVEHDLLREVHAFLARGPRPCVGRPSIPRRRAGHRVASGSAQPDLT